MKILYILVENSGHHVPYLKALLNDKNDNFCIVPSEIKDITAKQYIVKYDLKRGNYDLLSHIKYMKKIAQIAKKEKINIIHFTFGDILYKSFSIAMRLLKQFKIVVSFHRMDNKLIKNISRILIAMKADAITTHVVDSEKLLPMSLRNKCSFVAYPSVLEEYVFTKSEARKFLKINTTKPIIAVVGMLSAYKGIDIFFDAISQIKKPYYLIIAGRPCYYSAEYVEKRVRQLECDNLLLLRFIEDDVFVACIAASDIVAVPYLKSFEGTSGPMTEGIRLKKTIVGCDHGNIGKYLKEYKIGYSCTAGNVDSLKDALSRALDNPIIYTSETDKLVKMQTVEGFRENFYKLYQALVNY